MFLRATGTENGPDEGGAMAFGVADIPDLSGRVAVVTGANSGLGLQTASVLAAKGAHVLLAARDEPKLARAMDTITGSTPDATLTAVLLDLGNLARWQTLPLRSCSRCSGWTCWSTTPE